MKIDHVPPGTWLEIPLTTAYTFMQPSKPVGYWVMYPQGPLHTSFAMYHKPTDEQIKNTEQLLGWGWRDEV
jgi:hypothetical protein